MTPFTFIYLADAFIQSSIPVGNKEGIEQDLIASRCEIAMLFFCMQLVETHLTGCSLLSGPVRLPLPSHWKLINNL